MLLLNACGGAQEEIQTELARGKLALEQGKPAEADAALLKVIQLDTAHVEAIYLRGKALEQLDRPAESYSHYLRAIDLAPANNEYALAALELELKAREFDKAEERLNGLSLSPSQGTLWQARISAGRRDWNKASKLYKQVVATPNLDTRTLLDAARATLQAGGDTHQVKTLLDRAQSRSPDDPGIQALRARVELQDGSIDKAIEQLTKAHRADPANVDTSLRLGGILSRQGRAEEAISVYEKTLAEAPKRDEVRLVLGDLLSREGHWAKLRELIDNSPPNSRNAEGIQHYLNGLHALGTGDGQADVALNELRKATLLLDQTPGVWFAYGQAALAAGQRTTALSAYEKTLALSPNLLAAALQSARIEMLQSNLRGADVRLRALRSKHPDNTAIETLSIQLGLLEGQAEKAAKQAAMAYQKSKEPAFINLQAQALTQLGRDEEALALYQQRLESGDQESRIDAARTLAKLGRLKAAEDMLRAATSNEPGKVLEARGLLSLQAGKPDQARELLTRALDENPRLFEAQLNLAMLDVTGGKLDRAKERLSMAEKLAPNDPLLHQTMGMIAQAQVDLPQAEKHYLAALRANADLVLARTGLAEVQLATGRPLEAIGSAKRALKVSPDSARAGSALAAGHAALGELDKALAAYDQVLSRTPDDVEALIQRGRIQLRLGNPSDALSDFDKALSNVDSHGAALVGRLDALLLLDRADEAMAELDKRLTANPGNVFLLRLKGTLLVRAGRGGEAVDELKAVLDKEPRNPATVLLLAKALSASGRVDEAISQLRESEANSVSPQPLRMYQAQLLERKGDMVAAIDLYRQVLQASPDYPSALNNLALALHSQGDTGSEALSLATRAHSLAPDSVAIADTLGVLLTEAGRAAEAVGILSKISQRVPGNSEVSLHLAEALLGAGQSASATQGLMALRNLDNAIGQRARDLLKQIENGTTGNEG